MSLSNVSSRPILFVTLIFLTLTLTGCLADHRQTEINALRSFCELERPLTAAEVPELGTAPRSVREKVASHNLVYYCTCQYEAWRSLCDEKSVEN